MGELSGPTAERSRIDGLDVARGFALMGIFFVNIFMMAFPLGKIMEIDPISSGAASEGVHHLTRIFFESKSYPLFSMLFGMGLILMYDRAKDAGRPFVARYLRRLAMLLLMGIAHILLLWYGDILVYYSIIGFIMMWLAPLRPKTMLVLSGSLVVFATVVAFGFALLMYWAESGMAAEDGAVAAEVSTLEESPEVASSFGEFMEQLQAGEIEDGPFDPLWYEFEAQTHAQGPYGDAVAMRAFNWFSGLIFWVGLNGVGIHIMGMFLLGGALMRSGFFDPAKRHLPTRFLWIGLLVGVPMAVLAQLIAPPPGDPPGIGTAVSHSITLLFGPLVSLLYLSVAALAAQSWRTNPLVRAVASAGRMALTNYLTQTLIIAILMHHWGFRWYGTLDRVQLAGLVLLVYSAQLVFSSLWLTVFTMGPLEWAWRAWTYLRLPGIRRIREAT